MSTMRFHCLQHAPSEGPGNIALWARERHHKLTLTKLFESAALPRENDFDALIILGGPMSVHDETEFSWLIAEKQLIATTIWQRRKILGICLGSQLIAAVCGSPVFANPEKEIGFMPVHYSAEASRHPLFAGLSPDPVVFHWHGETFDLPQGSIHLAYSPACRNQAYLIGDQVLALQYHLELTPDMISHMTAEGIRELVPGKYIHSAEKISSERYQLESCKKDLYRLMDNFFTS
jgi:GMP synthase-like glutamine amidotransferase